MIKAETKLYWKVLPDISRPTGDLEYYYKDSLSLKGDGHYKISEYNQEELKKFLREQRISLYRQYFRHLDIEIANKMSVEDVLEFADMYDRFKNKKICVSEAIKGG